MSYAGDTTTFLEESVYMKHNTHFKTHFILNVCYVLLSMDHVVIMVPINFYLSAIFL